MSQYSAQVEVRVDRYVSPIRGVQVPEFVHLTPSIQQQQTTRHYSSILGLPSLHFRVYWKT